MCEMAKQLYFVENMGCDDSTCGLVWISDEDFPKFKSFIENLNKNSTYGCMPKIHVFRTDISDFKEFDYNPDLDVWDEGYVRSSAVFYLDGKTFTYSDKADPYDYNWEQVI